MSKKRVLITGSNGVVGSLLRPLFSDSEVVLTSRHSLEYVEDNEINVSNADLLSLDWLGQPQIGSRFDIILHLAEFMNDAVDMEAAVEAHLRFFEWATTVSTQVVYPLTAYLYDRKKRNSKYVQIKRNVFLRSQEKCHIFFPIIHPLIDGGIGLSRQIKIFKKIAPFNLFSVLDAEINVLSVNDLDQLIFFNEQTAKVFDVYTTRKSISAIFFNESRLTLNWASHCVRALIIMTPFGNARDLLLYGRTVDHSKIV
tara:strand:+ start:7074 stop:7838 length:765 start_codon:yes stop_codon:yes gene_type:complete